MYTLSKKEERKSNPTHLTTRTSQSEAAYVKYGIGCPAAITTNHEYWEE